MLVKANLISFHQHNLLGVGGILSEQSKEYGELFKTVLLDDYKKETMKRQTAWKYVYTLCERFDLAITAPEQYPIPVLRAWLFGSMLTDKPEPGNINLIVEVDSTQYVRTYRSTPIPLMAVLKNYRRLLARYHAGMKLIRMDDIELGQSEPGWWFLSHGMPENTPYYLIWQRGNNWQEILQAIQDTPQPYKPMIQVGKGREEKNN